MLQISLIFVGVTFFLNGFLPLIKENDNNETGIMNVLTGFLVAIIAIFGIVGNTDFSNNIYYVSILFFAITCFYYAAVCIWDLSESSFGWLCAIIAVAVIALGIYYILTSEVLLGILWLVWSFVWIFNFLAYSLNLLRSAKNYVVMLEGFVAMLTISILSLFGYLIF